jgi:hypothetical protein
MGDAATCGHPVDVARSDRLHRSQTVAMLDLTLEEIGDRGETDVRMRRDVDALPRSEVHLTHVIEEREGPDRASPGRWEHPVDRHTAEIAGAGLDHHVDSRGRYRARAHRLERGSDAHDDASGPASHTTSFHDDHDRSPKQHTVSFVWLDDRRRVPTSRAWRRT